jgi:hypothetical protein
VGEWVRIGCGVEDRKVCEEKRREGGSALLKGEFAFFQVNDVTTT